MNQPTEIDVQDIDHLGLIAGIVDEIGIADITNHLLGTHPLEQVSAGYVVKALILNCLGFLTAPLYLFSQFFEGKATEHTYWRGGETRTPRAIAVLVESSTSSMRKD
jgi:hypothetical protein